MSANIQAMTTPQRRHQTDPQPATRSGTFAIGGDVPVHRLGFGAMRLTGPGVWGEPADRTEAIAVLRRAIELGINLIDTADSYGPYVSEELIREALHPYERIDLFQLHRIDPKVSADDQFGLLRDLQSEGKVRHVGLSEVNVAEIEAARRIVPIATVQNQYNLVYRSSEDALDYCTRENIGFIPFFPLATGDLTKSGGPLRRAAARVNAQPSQVALAWLLKKSPVMLPIPGTSRVKHLEENTAAALLELDDSIMDELERQRG